MSAAAAQPQGVPIPVAHEVTIGAGRDRPAGRVYRPVEWASSGAGGSVSPAAAIADLLEAIEPVADAWWSPHTWTGDRRDGSKWIAAAALVVDVDFRGNDGEHAAPTSKIRAQLEQAATDGKLPGNVFHLTPRGARVVYVPAHPVTDRQVYGRVIEGACEETRRALEALGLHAQQDGRNGYAVDTAATDLARFLYAPRAIVAGEQREAKVRVLREDPYDLAVLAEAVQPQAPKPTPKHNGGIPGGARSSSNFTEAAARWNADHPQDWGQPGKGQCPACGHAECFGRLPATPDRWWCWSANHATDSHGIGHPTERGYLGDALDLEAQSRGCTRAEVLRADGYLTEAKPRNGKAQMPAAGMLEDEASLPNPTDVGNAERLALRFSDRLRFCHPWGVWIVWDGRRWARDREGEAVRMAKDTVRGIYTEAASAPDEATRRALARHADRSENQRRIAGMLELAKSDPGISVLPERFDGDATRYLLNVLNGTLDLRTGELREHRPEDFITALAPVEYREGAAAPRWRRFLEEVLPDGETRDYLQRFAGYALTGDTGEQVFALLYGTGANGKSTFLEALLTLLGDYGHKVAFSTFLRSRSTDERKAGPRPDLVQLKGKRLVVANESAEGRALDVATVKELTGGDTITARGLYQGESQEFRPQAKLMLAANHQPKIPDGTEAIWRRVSQVPFTVTVPEDKRDPKLPDTLRSPDELAGILWWAVQGCMSWRAGGLRPPVAVLEASREYRSSEDFIAGFLEAKCIQDRNARVRARTLYEAFRAWCSEVDEEPVSVPAFGRALEEHGFPRARETGGGRMRRGLRLRDMYDREGE